MHKGRLKPWGALQTPGPWKARSGFLFGTSYKIVILNYFFKMLNHDRKVRKSYPYLTTARFPHNWAVADMVKGYLAGTRKEHNRQSREEEVEKKRYVWLIYLFFCFTIIQRQQRHADTKKGQRPALLKPEIQETLKIFGRGGRSTRRPCRQPPSL